MIEDKELRDLFKAESEEHLQSLDEGLLHLEKTPSDTATLEQVFRDAHSLKGTARMLGITSVEAIGHHFEDALGAAARGKVVLTSEVIDRLYRGLDAIRKLVHEAVTGENSGVDVARVLAQLSGESVPVEAAAAAEGVLPPQQPDEQLAPIEAQIEVQPLETAIALPAATEIVDTTLVALNVESPAPPEEQALTLATEAPAQTMEVAATALSPEFKIGTLRVEPARLDALMTMAGELTVTTNRVTRGLGEFEAIGELWEECNKDAHRNRSLLADLESNAHNGAAVALKQLSSFHERQQARLEQIGVLLGKLRQTTYEDVTRLNFVADELEEGIRKVRLLPLSTIFNLFGRMVRDLARTQLKEVQLIIEGGETAADKRILEELKDPLMHMVRNSVDHGIERPDERADKGKPRQSTLRLRACQSATNVIVEIEDDGRGLDLEAIKKAAMKKGIAREEELAAMTDEQIQMLIFSPGFSTSALVTDVSGRGVGMDVVRANVERLRGTIEIESRSGAGCTFRVLLPITLATTRVLLVQAEGRTYALPVEFVEGMAMVLPQQIFSIEGRETYQLEGQAVSIARLSHLLEIRETRVTAPSKHKSPQSSSSGAASSDKALPCIFLGIGGQSLGLIVDELIDEQEVMLKPLGAMLGRVRNVSGATILGTGEVCMVLNPNDLFNSARKSPTRRALPAAAEMEARTATKKIILLVEDSITTRTQEKRILEGAGYEVVTAVDGLDGFHKLGTREFDAIVSDIEMPNMTGLALAEKIRQDAKYQEVPIILVSSLASEEDKRRGIEVGANAYITKGAFEQKVLLDTLGRLA